MRTIKPWETRCGEDKGRGVYADYMQADITELREALQVAEAELGELPEIQVMLLSENKALQAKLSAIEAQESVGHFTLAYGRYSQIDPDCWPKGGGNSVPLFAAPVAPAQPLTKEQVQPLEFNGLTKEETDATMSVRGLSEQLQLAHPKERVPLKDERIEEAAERVEATDPTDSFWKEFARAIETEIKNAKA